MFLCAHHSLGSDSLMLIQRKVDNPVSLENVEAKVKANCLFTLVLFSENTQWIDEILEYCPGVKVREELYTHFSTQPIIASACRLVSLKHLSASAHLVLSPEMRST